MEKEMEEEKKEGEREGGQAPSERCESGPNAALLGLVDKVVSLTGHCNRMLREREHFQQKIDHTVQILQQVLRSRCAVPSVHTMAGCPPSLSRCGAVVLS